MRVHRTTVALVAGITATATVVAAAAGPRRPEGTEPAPRPAPQAIADLLERYDVVAIGESHSLAEAGNFYRKLVRNADFQSNVDDIVVEFGNSRYQHVVDDYLRGRDVPFERLRKVGEDTTQVGTWDAPMYRRFFGAVRAVNRSLPRHQKLRVLLGDPPIKWREINSFEEWDEYALRRERHMARVIRRRVLSNGRTAVVIAGILHLRRGESELMSLLDRWRPGETFVVVTHLGFPNIAWERRLYDWQPPALATLDGTWISNLPRGDGKAADTYDGILYLGNPSFLHLSQPLPTLYRDDAYWHELKSRYRIVSRKRFRPSEFFRVRARYPDSGIDETEIRKLYQFSACMREEGVEAFPDPHAGFDFIGWTKAMLDQAKNDPDYVTARDICTARLGVPFA